MSDTSNINDVIIAAEQNEGVNLSTTWLAKLRSEPLTAATRAILEKVEGIIFDVQRYSLHDGPGLRTNVFLKGCPLRCDWCSNPESQNRQPELALFAHNCMACGQFEPACPTCWPGNGSAELPEVQYQTRAEACPTGAIHWIGQRRTAADVIREVLRDKPFYEDGGGMTLTGGEATMQPEMAEALLRLAKAENISTALETSGHTRWRVFERLVPYLDDILFDLKHVDGEVHQMYAGTDNELILANLRRLVAVDAPVTIRVPLIPGFNTTSESVLATVDFIKSLSGSIKAIDLLPYHTLGKAKYKALGREYPWQAHKRLTDEEIESVATVLRSTGLPVIVGG